MKSPTHAEILEALSGAFNRASNGRASVDRLEDGARIIEDVGLSSLDILDFRCELEQLWQVQIADEELAEIHTVGEVIQFIKSRTARGQCGS